MNKDNNAKKNLLNRIIIITLMLFIVFLVVLNFFCTKPYFTISYEILICLLLLVVICLSENFDNLSIPKILHLSRNLKKEQENNDRLREYNIKLIEQINNTNRNTQINYMPGSINTTSSNSIETIKQEDIIRTDDNGNSNSKNKSLTERHKQFKEGLEYRKNLSIFVLKKYLDAFDIKDVSYNVDVKNIGPTDNIKLETTVNFDALQLTEFSCTFFDVKTGWLSIETAHLYEQLKTVELYGQRNNLASKLVLLVPKVDKEISDIVGINPNLNIQLKLLNRDFSPAIANKMLEIREINVSKDEMDKYICNLDNKHKN